jgi:hypothetical protein
VSEHRIGLVEHPLEDAIGGERRELHRRASIGQELVRLAPRRRDQQKHRVRRRPQQVRVEQLAGVLLQLVDLTHHHHPPVGKHRRCAEQHVERFRIELAATPLLEVEVARRRVDRRLHDLPDTHSLQEVVLPEKVVHGVERTLLERRVERLFSCGCHVRNIQTNGSVGARRVGRRERRPMGRCGDCVATG